MDAGYYWIRRGDWMGVAELDEAGEWLVPGKEYSVNPDGVEVIGTRLTPPEGEDQ